MTTIEKAKHWRDRADECYALAALRCSEQTYEQIIGLARRCDEQAAFFEQLAKLRAQPPEQRRIPA